MSDPAPTLRDRFAMAALTGMLSAPRRFKKGDQSIDSPETYSAAAYEFADAMMRNRIEEVGP